MRLFLESRTPNILGLDAKATSSTIFKSSFTLCRPSDIYSVPDIVAAFHLVCSTGKIIRNAFYESFWTFYKTSPGSLVPLGFVHSVICQKSLVINNEGELFVDNVFQSYVVFFLEVFYLA